MREAAIEAMKAYYGNRHRSVDHTLKVLGYAEEIMKGESITAPFLTEVVVLAAILHDVGIPAALTKYGSVSHHQQEAEGVPVARRVLARLQVRADVAERVCYIANFSTPTGARLIRQVLGL